MRDKRTVKYAQKLRNSVSLVVDGETELWYLQKLKEYHQLPFRFSPALPQRKSLEEQYALVKKNAVDYEKVFWILDMDVIIRESRNFKPSDARCPLNLLKHFIDEIEKQKMGNVCIIANTPGFEFWILLHFKNTKKYYENCDQVIAEIHKCEGMEGYEKTQKFFMNSGKGIYKRLLPKITRAIDHSRQTGSIDFENIEIGLSQMWKLFDELEIVFSGGTK